MLGGVRHMRRARPFSFTVVAGLGGRGGGGGSGSDDDDGACSISGPFVYF